MGQHTVADYAIGDIQGCFDALIKLLDHINFNEKIDRLWFAGDLVNRGKQSLDVLRFIKNLPKTRIVLGNHDLHLLYRLFIPGAVKHKEDTLNPVLEAEDALDLGHWLRKQPIICYADELNVLMAHAGLPPCWDLPGALAVGAELEAVLAGDNFEDFLKHMYGNKPDRWSDSLTGMERLRSITNYFTRMRFCDAEGHLDFKHAGRIEDAPAGLYPWFAMPRKKPLDVDIVFGHWAALMGFCPFPGVYAIDTGCVWGGKLTALRLQDKQRFSVEGT